MITALLSPFRSRNDLRIDDLVHFAAEIVPQVAGPQLRYKVTSIPDSRTVRYYIQQGLIDPPHGASGPAALYGYRHLLQLVLVKVLQAHYLPIRQIRQTIEKLNNSELEKLLESWRSKTPLPPPSAFYAAAVKHKESPREEAAPAQAASPPSAEALLRSFHFRSEAVGDLVASEALPSEPALHQPGADGAISTGGWTRHELYPGIELHVHDDVVIPPGSSFASALASRLRVIIEKVAIVKVASYKRSKP